MKIDHRARFHEALGITTDAGPDEIFAWYFLICGPSCIGKSIFIAKNGLYRTRPRPGAMKEKFMNMGGHHEVAVNSHPKHWPSGLFSEDYIIKKGAIILGIPLEEWLKRIHKRKRHLVMKTLPTMLKYEKKCTKQLKLLNTLNIPYIFVDNRNDYPILDESSFFTMIRS